MTELERLQTEVELLRMSNDALLSKLRKVQRVSKSRLARMRQRTKLLIEARGIIMRMQDEAHGG